MMTSKRGVGTVTGGIFATIVFWFFGPEDLQTVVAEHPIIVKAILASSFLLFALIIVLGRIAYNYWRENVILGKDYQEKISSIHDTFQNNKNELREEIAKLKESLNIEKEKKIKLEKQKDDEINLYKENLKQKDYDIAKTQTDYNAHIQQKDTLIKTLIDEKQILKTQNEELNKKIETESSESQKKYDSILEKNNNLAKTLNDLRQDNDENLKKINELNKVIINDNSFENINTWRHTVLIIDDKAKVIIDMKNRLDDLACDIVYMSRLDDYRLVENFEIVISDIIGCSKGDDAVETLNTIKEKYPYKFVFAMSSAPAECHGLKIDGEIIEKDPTGIKYIRNVKELIKSSIAILDNPTEHWENVYHYLVPKYKSRTKKIEIIKKNYVSTLKRLSLVTQ
jgi:hypothetical protein